MKECFECHPKPGSPTLCHQCLWVREHYKPPVSDWKEQLMNEFEDVIRADYNAVEFEYIPKGDPRPDLIAFISNLLTSQRQQLVEKGRALKFNKTGWTFLNGRYGNGNKRLSHDEALIFNEAIDQFINLIDNDNAK